MPTQAKLIKNRLNPVNQPLCADAPGWKYDVKCIKQVHYYVFKGMPLLCRNELWNSSHDLFSCFGGGHDITGGCVALSEYTVVKFPG